MHGIKAASGKRVEKQLDKLTWFIILVLVESLLHQCKLWILSKHSIKLEVKKVIFPSKYLSTDYSFSIRNGTWRLHSSSELIGLVRGKSCAEVKWCRLTGTIITSRPKRQTTTGRLSTTCHWHSTFLLFCNISAASAGWEADKYFQFWAEHSVSSHDFSRLKHSFY